VDTSLGRIFWRVARAPSSAPRLVPFGFCV
jgi:hypothetical protein